jgi:hypothetical protein
MAKSATKQQWETSVRGEGINEDINEEMGRRNTGRQPEKQIIVGADPKSGHPTHEHPEDNQRNKLQLTMSSSTDSCRRHCNNKPKYTRAPTAGVGYAGRQPKWPSMRRQACSEHCDIELAGVPRIRRQPEKQTRGVNNGVNEARDVPTVPTSRVDQRATRLTRMATGRSQLVTPVHEKTELDAPTRTDKERTTSTQSIKRRIAGVVREELPQGTRW